MKEKLSVSCIWKGRKKKSLKARSQRALCERSSLVSSSGVTPARCPRARRSAATSVQARCERGDGCAKEPPAGEGLGEAGGEKRDREGKEEKQVGEMRVRVCLEWECCRSRGWAQSAASVWVRSRVGNVILGTFCFPWCPPFAVSSLAWITKGCSAPLLADNRGAGFSSGAWDFWVPFTPK